MIFLITIYAFISISILIVIYVSMNFLRLRVGIRCNLAWITFVRIYEIDISSLVSMTKILFLHWWSLDKINFPSSYGIVKLFGTWISRINSLLITTIISWTFKWFHFKNFSVSWFLILRWHFADFIHFIITLIPNFTYFTFVIVFNKFHLFKINVFFLI